MVLGLKRDLRSEDDPNDIIYPQEAYRVAQEMRADKYAECSTVTGDLFKLAFEEICSIAFKTVTANGGQSEGGGSSGPGCHRSKIRSDWYACRVEILYSIMSWSVSSSAGSNWPSTSMTPLTMSSCCSGVNRSSMSSMTVTRFGTLVGRRLKIMIISPLVRS